MHQWCYDDAGVVTLIDAMYGVCKKTVANIDDI